MQSFAIVHIRGLLGPSVKGISSQNDENCRQLWTIEDKYPKPPFENPHSDFPDKPQIFQESRAKILTGVIEAFSGTHSSAPHRHRKGTENCPTKGLHGLNFTFWAKPPFAKSLNFPERSQHFQDTKITIRAEVVTNQLLPQTQCCNFFCVISDFKLSE